MLQRCNIRQGGGLSPGGAHPQAENAQGQVTGGQQQGCRQLGGGEGGQGHCGVVRSGQYHNARAVVDGPVGVVEAAGQEGEQRPGQGRHRQGGEEHPPPLPPEKQQQADRSPQQGQTGKEVQLEAVEDVEDVVHFFAAARQGQGVEEEKQQVQQEAQQGRRLPRGHGGPHPAEGGEKLPKAPAQEQPGRAGQPGGGQGQHQQCAQKAAGLGRKDQQMLGEKGGQRAAQDQGKQQLGIDQEIHGHGQGEKPSVGVGAAPLKAEAPGQEKEKQRIAHQRGKKEIHQGEHCAAAHDGGKAEETFLRTGRWRDRGRIAAQQVVRRDLQGPGQGDQQGDVGVSPSRFP